MTAPRDPGTSPIASEAVNATVPPGDESPAKPEASSSPSATAPLPEEIREALAKYARRGWYIEARVGSHNYRGDSVRFINDRRGDPTLGAGESSYENGTAEEVVCGLLDLLARAARALAARASEPAPPVEPRDPDARVKKGFRIGIEAAAKHLDAATFTMTKMDPPVTPAEICRVFDLVCGELATEIRALAEPARSAPRESREEAEPGTVQAQCPGCSEDHSVFACPTYDEPCVCGRPRDEHGGPYGEGACGPCEAFTPARAASEPGSAP